MAYSVQMLRKHPRPIAGAVDVLSSAIDACYDCAETCSACADACLGEERVAALVTCIRLNLDCADICHTTGAVLSRQTAIDLTIVRAQVKACIAAVKACAEECLKHAGEHDHCRVCAEACRMCEQTCDELLKGPAAPSS